MNRRYTDAQIMWLETNGYSRVWKNRAEFRAAFNETFNLSVSESKFNNLVLWYNIKICTKQTESLFTEEQKAWLIENARSGLFDNCRHLTDTYNALFKECRRSENINGYLAGWGISLNTKYKGTRYTEEMDAWLRENYPKLGSIADVTEGFNKTFGESRTETAIAGRCRRIGAKRPASKFKKGQRPPTSLDVGTIRKRKKVSYIKVGDSGRKSDWMPLHKYVWEKHYGKVPEGYCVVFLNGDKTDVSIENLALIDRRGTPTMAHFGWWSDNRTLTKTAVRWCNLNCMLNDNI